MLTYRVNENHLTERRKAIKSSTVEVVDLSNLPDDGSYNNLRLIYVFDTDDIGHLNEFSKVSCTHKFDFNYIKNPEDRHLQEYSIDEEFEIQGFDAQSGIFSISIDKFIELGVEEIESASLSEDGSDGVVIFRFNDRHFFDYDRSFPTLIHFYGNGFESFETFEVDVVDYKTLSIPYSKLTLTDEGEMLYEGMFGSRKFVRKIVLGSPFSIIRDNWRFTGKGVHQFYLETISYSIPIGLSNSFGDGLLQEENIGSNFVDVEMGKVIPSINDLEKDVYKPAVYNKDKNGYLVKTSDVFKMVFNLHFREHRGTEWIADRESYWNGVTKNKKGEFVVNADLTSDDKGDLLAFLGFSNSDVYYQKNKLSKSFLRLSFYDSPSPLNQNLYAYSTIFFDGGDTFKKYVKNKESKRYFDVVDMNKKSGEYAFDKKNVKDNISVSREYITSDDNSETSEEIDAHRLSARFTVEDKNETLSSSEGFYIYTWKDNETNNLPKNLYMKVEFNHAGYGRTIPFMIPFWDKKKHSGKSGVKTFSEIVKDFSTPKFEENKCDGIYGVQQYNKYSYIYLKYMFDKETEEYNYFLDPDVYGVIKDTSELVFNLYEAKVGKRYEGDKG